MDKVVELLIKAGCPVLKKPANLMQSVCKECREGFRYYKSGRSPLKRTICDYCKAKKAAINSARFRRRHGI
jgi:hypothetical protein